MAILKDTNKVSIPIIQDASGKYLLITRSEYPEHKGEWGPIAGHLKTGESIEEALIRETKEELNLDIRPVRQLAEIPQDIVGDIGYWWQCEILGGEIKTNEEIDEIGYFTSDKIKKLKLWPATKYFFENYIWPKTWNLKFASLNKPDDIFDLIVGGKKTVETRSRNPNDGDRDYTNVKAGDILHFKSIDTNKELEKIVVSNHVYDSVEEMVKTEDVEKILPGVGTKEKYIEILEQAKNKWGEKYKFELEHYGIVAISFR